MSLHGKVAIVTGASRGIGRAIAMALASQGADIIAASRAEPVPGTVEETALAVQGLGQKAIPIDMDVTAEEDVHRVVDAALNSFGRIDILVNNAGTNQHRHVVDLEPKWWNLIMRVNAYGPFLLSKYVLPHIIKQGNGGHILNISSMRSVNHQAGSSAYSASKAALDALTLSLALETEEDRICVNALRVDGMVETPGATMLLGIQTDGPMWPPEIVGEAASYICKQPFPNTGKLITVTELRDHVARIDEILSRLGN
ncbi:SDR family NAD(P)-dependent oxidoreductase [Dehalococcoidia bacterium]|nr:SDR family NAD(P)-dependent oxidoreductase [Dehalococcoidia bacterium]